MDDNSIHIIINPVAGGRRAGHQTNSIGHQIAQRFNARPKIHVTQQKGDGFSIGNQLRHQSARLVIVAGGDGTIHEVINGLFENGADISEQCTIGILNLGSGGGFAQTLELQDSLIKQIDVLSAPGCMKVDLGLIHYEEADGQYKQRLFINEFQLGIGAKVVADTGESLKVFGGTVAYGLSTIKNALTYHGPMLEVSLESGMQFSDRYLGVVIGNGSYTAGGMQLTPRASLNDGQLDLLLMHEMTIPERLLNFTRLYSGQHIYSKSFTTQTSTHFSITATKVLRAEADGEVFYLKNCKVKVLPSVLPVKAPGVTTTLKKSEYEVY